MMTGIIKAVTLIHNGAYSQEYLEQAIVAWKKHEECCRLKNIRIEGGKIVADVYLDLGAEEEKPIDPLSACEVCGRTLRNHPGCTPCPKPPPKFGKAVFLDITHDGTDEISKPIVTDSTDKPEWVWEELQPKKASQEVISLPAAPRLLMPPQHPGYSVRLKVDDVEREITCKTFAELCAVMESLDMERPKDPVSREPGPNVQYEHVAGRKQ